MSAEAKRCKRLPNFSLHLNLNWYVAELCNHVKWFIIARTACWGHKAFETIEHAFWPYYVTVSASNHSPFFQLKISLSSLHKTMFNNFFYPIASTFTTKYWRKKICIRRRFMLVLMSVVIFMGWQCVSDRFQQNRFFALFSLSSDLNYCHMNGYFDLYYHESVKPFVLPSQMW